MSFARQVARKNMKEEWRKFKKENSQYKQMPFFQFKTLWENQVTQASKEQVAQQLTQEQETAIEDIFIDNMEIGE